MKLSNPLYYETTTHQLILIIIKMVNGLIVLHIMVEELIEVFIDVEEILAEI